MAYRSAWGTSLAAFLIFTVVPARADENTASITSWLAMVTRTQEAQPRWITPLATVTPRLEQEFRYDFFVQTLPSHAEARNYGAGKGLELILTPDTEIIVGVPPYQTRSAAPGKPAMSGWGDWPALLVKYRFLSANEEQGNFILTGFLQLAVPSGTENFSRDFYVVQPTIAFGKGWGDFDVQMTLSEQFPTPGDRAKARNFGKPVLFNIAAQYHLGELFWPELEVNYTWWPDGADSGKSQTFLTPGIVLGRFQIRDRVRLIVGAGYQFALSPTLPAYRSNLLLTVRTTF